MAVMRNKATAIRHCPLLMAVFLAGSAAFGQTVASEPERVARPMSGPADPGRESVKAYELHEEELGTQTGAPVDSGFVFYDNSYLQPPYVVSRRGMGVFINEKLIKPPFLPWPLPGDDATLGAADPPLPTSIDATTTPWDDTLKEYLQRKAAYFEASYARDEAIARMAEAYRALPCVRAMLPDTQYHDTEARVVTWTNGLTENVRLLPLVGRRIQWTRERLIQELETNCRAQIEARLRKGDVYFFWGPNGPFTGGPGFVEKSFPQVLRILRSSDPDDEKIAALQRPEAGSVPQDVAALFVRGFSAPPELEERLAKHIERFQRERAERAKQPPSPPSPQPAPNGESGADVPRG